MIYPFSCPMCSHTVDVVRPAARHADPVPCPVCDHIMGQMYTVPQVNIGLARAGRSMLKNYKDGGTPVEMGTENPEPPCNQQEYAITGAMTQGMDTLNSL